MSSTRTLAQLLRSRHRLWQLNGSGKYAASIGCIEQSHVSIILGKRSVLPRIERVCAAGLWTQSHLFCGSSQLLRLESPAQSYGPNISALYPYFQQQWHPTANQHLGSIVIKRHSKRKVWWACNQSPDGHLHEWEASIHMRTRGRGRPQCSGHKLCKHSSLATNFPEVAPYWDGVQNGCTAAEVHSKSNQRAHWKCRSCSHAWLDAPQHRVCAVRACPACNVDDDRQPNMPHPTFAACQHPLLQEWNFELNAAAGIFPPDVTLCSNKLVHWKCDKCRAGHQHLWVAPPHDRTSRKHVGCPFCASRAACKCNSLRTLRPAVAAEWHPSRNARTPDDYTYCSHYEAWWHSEQKGSWQQRIYDRVRQHDAAIAAGRNS